MASSDRTAASKSSGVFADRLRRDILRGQYTPGDALGTERVLASEAGVGRGSVREALRILETQGLVRTHAGRHGGSIVTRPSEDLLMQQIDAYAKTHCLPLLALVEARMAIEPMVAELAARRRTAYDLAELQRVADRLEAAAATHAKRFLQENAKWHDALAVACHSDLLRAFATSISRLMFDVSRIKNFATADVRAVVCRSHRRILAAIEQRDAAAARRRAERDIESYGKYLLHVIGALRSRGG